MVDKSKFRLPVYNESLSENIAEDCDLNSKLLRYRRPPSIIILHKLVQQQIRITLFPTTYTQPNMSNPEILVHLILGRSFKYHHWSSPKGWYQHTSTPASHTCHGYDWELCLTRIYYFNHFILLFSSLKVKYQTISFRSLHNFMLRAQIYFLYATFLAVF